MKLVSALFLGLLFTFFTASAQHADSSQSATILSLNDAALKLWKKSKYDTAIVVISRAEALAREERDTLLLAKTLANKGLIYCSKGDPVNGILFSEESVLLLQQSKNEDQIYIAILNLGISYKQQSVFDKAQNSLLEAVKYFEFKKDSGQLVRNYHSPYIKILAQDYDNKNLKNLSSAYNTIGNIHKELKEYREALAYHSRSLKIRTEIGYDEGIAGSINNIGTTYKMMGQYDSALIYLYKALDLKKDSDKPDKQAITLSQIAEVYYLMGNYPLAEKFFQRVNTIYKEIDNPTELAASYFDLGQLYYSQGIYFKSERCLLQALKLSEEVNTAGVTLKCYDVLRKLYKETANLSKALYYSEKFITLNEEVLGQEKQKTLQQMSVKYESEKKNQQIKFFKEEKEKTRAIVLAQELKLEAENIYNRNLAITIVLLLLVVLLLALLFRDRNRFAKKLDMVMRELHHRVKNNFQVLLSLFNLQMAGIKDEETRQLIGSNSDRVTAMMLIHGGLYFDEDVTKVKIGRYIETLVDNLLVVYSLQSRNIKINYHIDENLDISVDKAIPLGLLINELVTNSLKYAFGPGNTDPLLNIDFFRGADERYHLVIRDNGPGAATVGQKRSFGLKLSENQVKQLKGTIRSSSDNGLKYEIGFE